MKARDLLYAIEAYARSESQTPEQLLCELSDDKLKVAVYASAELFKSLRTEAVRRGIWDSIKTKKVD